MTDQPSPLYRIDRRTLVTNILTLFSGTAISQGLTALVLLLIARQLGPEQYGQYASAIVLASFLAIFFSLGLDVWLLREGGSRPNQIGVLGGSVIGVKTGLGSLWLVTLFVLASQIQAKSFTAELFRLAIFIVWLDSLLTTFQAIFKAALRNQITSTLLVASDLAWFLTTLILLVRGEQDAAMFMKVRIVVLVFSVMAAGVVCRSLFVVRLHLRTLQRIFREFPPYFASELLVLSLLRADVLIISFTLGEESVGLYAPAVSLINAMYLIPSAVHGVMLPVLSNLFSSDIPRAWRMARRLVYIQGAIGLMLTLGVFFISPFLVGLLGPQYADSLEILKILSFNLFFRCISFAMVAVLVATQNQAKRTIAQAIAVLVNVCFNLAVVYWAGIRGIAVVYVATEIVLAGVYTLLVYSYRKKSESALISG